MTEETNSSIDFRKLQWTPDESAATQLRATIDQLCILLTIYGMIPVDTYAEGPMRKNKLNKIPSSQDESSQNQNPFSTETLLYPEVSTESCAELDSAVSEGDELSVKKSTLKNKSIKRIPARPRQYAEEDAGLLRPSVFFNFITRFLFLLYVFLLAGVVGFALIILSGGIVFLNLTIIALLGIATIGLLWLFWNTGIELFGWNRN